MDAAFPAVEAEGLVKTYPGRRPWRQFLRRGEAARGTEALRGLNLRVAVGTVHGLLGANGAGKTTLLKILATLVLPTAGRVRVLGHDPAVEGASVRCSLGVVTAEERSFYWRLSGRANLTFFAALHDLTASAAKARVSELLALVGLEGDADRPFREYSTGMRQRLALARGLLAQPRLLLMDEPTRGLDPPTAQWLRAFVREQLARARGVTVLLATHDLAEAEATCDRLSLVRAGRVVADGTPHALKDSLAGARPAVLTLLGELPALVAALFSAPTSAGEGRSRTTFVGDDEALARAIAELVRAGGRLVHVQREEANLLALFDPVLDGRAPRPRGGSS